MVHEGFTSYISIDYPSTTLYKSTPTPLTPPTLSTLLNHIYPSIYREIYVMRTPNAHDDARR